MAKFSCEFDTVEKTVSVRKDGEEMANVQGVEIYQSWMDEGKMQIRVVQGEYDKDHKLSTLTVMMASKDGSIQTSPAPDDVKAKFIPPLFIPEAAKGLARVIAGFNKAK